MESVENKSEAKILSSGPEFFHDFGKAIDGAKDFILIKQFLWRNDEVGRRSIRSLLEAMERGVKVYVYKDRIGAFHEYSERTGQSFFHDKPQDDSVFDTHSLRTVYLQSRFMVSRFYGNGVSPQEENPLRGEFMKHPNSEVIDYFKLYDHSKVIVVDSNIAYVGGVGFGDEFMGDEEKKPWSDYMLKIVDEGECAKLLRLLSLGKVEDGSAAFQFLNDTALQESGGSLHDYVLRFIAEARETLFVEVPFLGHPDYINQITDAVGRRVKTVVVLPANANSHRYRNIHFLKRLIRQVGHSGDLSVRLNPNMMHGKVIIADDAMLFGSHNLHMDRSVLEDTVVRVTNDGLVENMKRRIAQNASTGENFDNSVDWGKIIVPSRAEYASIKLQTLMARTRRAEIQRCRKVCSESVRSLLAGCL